MCKAKFFVYGMILCLVLAFTACGSAPPPNTSSGGASIGGGGGGGTSGGGRPEWVRSVDSVYPKAQYVAAVGSGNDRQTAEKQAFAALVSIYGQSIAIDEKISTLYQDMVKSGGISNWTESNTAQIDISRQASMDRLVGAEIKEVWNDPSGTVYAVALMEKAQAAGLYSDMVKANLGMINNLVNMTPAEKNSLGGYSRYQFAAVLADINTSHKNVLDVIGARSPDGIQTGFYYRQELENIAAAIPIGVVVTGDTTGRVQAAISGVLSELGFRSGGNNSRYRVEATLTIREEPNPASQYTYVRSEIIATLVDTVPSKTTLVPYSVNNREGHNNLEGARQRALSKVESGIKEDFKVVLNEYLSRMLPKK